MGGTGSPKGNKNLFNMSKARLFKKNCCTVLVSKAFLSVLTLSPVVWLHVRSENEPKKISQCRYFLGVFQTNQKKKKFALVRPPPVDKV